MPENRDRITQALLMQDRYAALPHAENVDDRRGSLVDKAMTMLRYPGGKDLWKAARYVMSGIPDEDTFWQARYPGLTAGTWTIPSPSNPDTPLARAAGAFEIGAPR